MFEIYAVEYRINPLQLCKNNSKAKLSVDESCTIVYV